MGRQCDALKWTCLFLVLVSTSTTAQEAASAGAQPTPRRCNGLTPIAFAERFHPQAGNMTIVTWDQNAECLVMTPPAAGGPWILEGQDLILQGGLLWIDEPTEIRSFKADAAASSPPAKPTKPSTPAVIPGQHGPAGIAGTSGSSGASGRNASNVLLLANDVGGPSTLTFALIGEDGGAGQDGAEGGNGAAGSKGNSRSCGGSPRRRCRGNASGFNGGPGGTGGDGGAGGSGGSGGTFRYRQILKSKLDTQIVVHLSGGAGGPGGQPGQAGSGGTYGPGGDGRQCSSWCDKGAAGQPGGPGKPGNAGKQGSQASDGQRIAIQ